jgi:hypothetical protein
MHTERREQTSIPQAGFKPMFLAWDSNSSWELTEPLGQRFSKCGACPTPWGALLVLWRGWAVCTRDKFILNEICVQHKTYSGKHFAWLDYFTYNLEPILAPSYKQHVLASPKLRTVCYSLPELSYQICLFEFIRMEGGHEVHETS